MAKKKNSEPAPVKGLPAVKLAAPPWLVPLVVVSVTLAVRVLNQFFMTTDPLSSRPGLIPDAAHYYNSALTIAGGDWSLRPVFFMGPLYSYVLGVLFSLFGTGFMAPRLLHIILGTATVYLVYRTALDLRGRATAILTAILACFYYPFLFFERQLLAATLTTFLFAALLAVLSSVEKPGAKRLVAAGVLLGLAGLTKGMALFWAPFIVVYLVLVSADRREAARAVAVFLAAVLLMIAPATLHNYLLGHDLVPLSSNVGINLYIGSGKDSTGTWRPPDPKRPWIGRSPESLQEYAETLAGQDLKPSEVSRFWVRLTWQEIKQAPNHFIKELAIKFLLFWNYFEICNNNDYYLSEKFSPILHFLSFGFGFVAPFGLIGLMFVRLKKHHRFLLFGLVGAMLANALVFFVLARYRLPAVIALLIGTAAIIEEAWRRMVRNQWQWLVPPGVLIIAAVGMSRAPVITAHAKAEFHALYLTRLSEAQRLDNDPQEAELSLREAVRLQPEDAQIRVQLATLFYLYDKIEPAEREARVAVALDPDVPLAHFIVGLIAAKKNEDDEAVASFRAEIANHPGDFRAYYHLGRVLARNRNYLEARDVLSTAANLNPGDERVRKALAWLDELDIPVQTGSQKNGLILQSMDKYGAVYVAPR
ncbi:glycosyltransferase family 39 protein [bacterium]|nr:glycosyltransferase family 39 protein [candidate division CSSED10-310 bacterium]